jgi:hypothetical protein
MAECLVQTLTGHVGGLAVGGATTGEPVCSLISAAPRRRAGLQAAPGEPARELGLCSSVGRRLLGFADKEGCDTIRA